MFSGKVNEALGGSRARNDGEKVRTLTLETASSLAIELRRSNSGVCRTSFNNRDNKRKSTQMPRQSSNDTAYPLFAQIYSGKTTRIGVAVAKEW